MTKGKTTRARLRVGRETLRMLGERDLVGVRAGVPPETSTSEAAVGYPCPGEYSYFCSP